MTLAGFLLFAGIYTVAVASPGPGIAAIVARALGSGLTGMPWFILGFILGDFTLLLLAAFGLAVLVQTFAGLLTAIKLAGAAYLVYLAWTLWTAPAKAPGEGVAAGRADSPWRLFLTTYSLTIGNPKAIVFFMAVLPTIVDLGSISFATILEIGFAIVLVMTLVLGGYAIAADRARRLLTDAASVRKLNRVTAVVLAGAAAAVARG